MRFVLFNSVLLLYKKCSVWVLVFSSVAQINNHISVWKFWLHPIHFQLYYWIFILFAAYSSQYEGPKHRCILVDNFASDCGRYWVWRWCQAEDLVGIQGPVSFFFFCKFYELFWPISKLSCHFYLVDLEFWIINLGIIWQSNLWSESMKLALSWALCLARTMRKVM